MWEGFVGGVLYALIALGFVLIYKASGVFNFAQGIMMVFAALTLVGLHEKGVPAWIALALTIAVMYGLAVGIERLVLRPLVNQPDIILLMATLRRHLFSHRLRRTRVRRQPEGDDHQAALPARAARSTCTSSAARCSCRSSTSPRP